MIDLNYFFKGFNDYEAFYQLFLITNISIFFIFLIPNFLGLCSNLWLKNVLGFKLSSASKTLVESFNKKYDLSSLDSIKNNFINNIDNQELFEEISFYLGRYYNKMA